MRQKKLLPNLPGPRPEGFIMQKSIGMYLTKRCYHNWCLLLFEVDGPKRKCQQAYLNKQYRKALFFNAARLNPEFHMKSC